MKRIFRSTLACCALLLASTAFAAPPEKLTLADLANRPERWPVEVTVKRDYKFGGGKTVRAGSSVQVQEFDGAKLLLAAPGDLIFKAAPAETNFLEAANEAWAALTPDQRAVDPQAVAADASLWPAKVKLLSDIRFTDGTGMNAGSELKVLGVTPQAVSLWLEKEKSHIDADFAQTDILARARELAGTPREQRPSRVVESLTGLIGPDGKPYPVEKVQGGKIYVLYYGASWCGPCRKFSPSLVKYIKDVSAANPGLVVVMMSTDEKDADMLGYMKEEKMPWPGLPLATLKATPLLTGYAGQYIPQLTVVDRYGKILADSKNGDTAKAFADLKRIVASGAAK
jgi:thiol-disulfide isomerase/thioredoxin